MDVRQLPIQTQISHLQDRAGPSRRLLLNPDAYATALLLLFVDRYGAEGMEWHPQTIKMELEDDFKVRLPKATLDKLLAAITIVTTDLFFQDVARFITLANILAGDDFEPGEFDPADAFECAWAVAEAALLNPPETDKPYCEDIGRYIAYVLQEEGFVRPPGALKIALDADFSEQVQYDYADDPILFGQIWKTQEDKSSEVDTMVRENLLALAEQLSTLVLENGDTAQIVGKIRRAIQG